MADARIRWQIAQIAARLMYERIETEYFTAKRKAARQLGIEHRYRPGDLPSNAEIRDQIQTLANLYEGEQRQRNLLDMRLEALRMMRLLAAFRPRLIGSVLTGHIRKGSDIDIHLFTDHLSSVTSALEENHLPFTVQHKRIVKFGEERMYVHVHVGDRYNYELTVYPENKVNYIFKSSITGKAIERASIAELEQFVRAENPGIELDSAIDRLEDHIDRWELYRMLLQPLEKIQQNPAYHPEGDALYHSLQAFELARLQRPWDEEFLLAALLHDIGKGIDPSDHVAAGIQALEGAITPRTQFLIEHHMDAQAIRTGTLGHRAKLRLQEDENYEDLLLLRDIDDAARERGVMVCTVREALAHLRKLEQECEDDA